MDYLRSTVRDHSDQHGETTSKKKIKIKELSTYNFISSQAKLHNEEERKSSMDKQLLRDFVITRPALQVLLKEALNKESNNQYQPLQ